MKIKGKLVDWLLEIDFVAYNTYVVYEKGVKTLYLVLHKAIYGMLVASMLWYRKFRADLEEIGFRFNKFDPCVANREINGGQHTIRYHVDDVISSHQKSSVNDDFAKWANQVYGQLKPVEIRRGKIHDYLGMQLDFKSDPGKVRVSQFAHVKDMLDSWPKKLEKSDIAKTPAPANLFGRDGGELLSNDDRELFHSLVMKGLFIAKRSRPDILPATTVLSGRVQKPVDSDWKKLHQLVKYLNGTQKLHLVIDMRSFRSPQWFVDAAYGVHPDFKSHSGGVLMSSNNGGAIIAGSNKQKLNTRSSTEAELVAGDDFLPRILHTKRFLQEQGLRVGKPVLKQDNKSTILLHEKGRSSLGKRTRHLELRYFYLHDNINRGEIKIEYCPADKMVADYMSKPLQGTLFEKFRKAVLGM